MFHLFFVSRLNCYVRFSFLFVIFSFHHRHRPFCKVFHLLPIHISHSIHFRSIYVCVSVYLSYIYRYSVVVSCVYILIIPQHSIECSLSMSNVDHEEWQSDTNDNVCRFFSSLYLLHPSFYAFYFACVFLNVFDALRMACNASGNVLYVTLSSGPKSTPISCRPLLTSLTHPLASIFHCSFLYFAHHFLQEHLSHSRSLDSLPAYTFILFFTFSFSSASASASASSLSSFSLPFFRLEHVGANASYVYFCWYF